MTRLIFHVRADQIPTTWPDGEIHVHLYGGRPASPGVGAVGHQAMEACRRLGVSPGRTAVDLIAIASAVTAADTFVLRADAANSWNRDIDIVLPLAGPEVWQRVAGRLESLLRFLSGDNWKLEFVAGGVDPPASFEIRTLQPAVDITRIDYVALFSGGLDSGIFAREVIGKGERALLISHSSTGDASYQQDVLEKLPGVAQRLAVNTYPTWSEASEDSSRARSFNFIALGALAAHTRSILRGGVGTRLIVPENGLIALNAPLTPRRIGALSTRTTHPHFLTGIQEIFDDVGLLVCIENPYELFTKGEMVGRIAQSSDAATFAAATVSCGKWKRHSMQCGKCVPCLIRRASLYAGNVDDLTDYEWPDLISVMGVEDHRDDLVSMMTAAKRLETNNLARWVERSGPLPTDLTRRAALLDVHRRGILEVSAFLRDSGLPV